MQGYAEGECKARNATYVYIDPSYMKKDNMHSQYHILETLARGDEPGGYRY